MNDKTKFDGKKLHLTNEEWKKRLSPQQYAILREAKTERAFCGDYFNQKEPGIYHCAACGLPLFISKAKYDSKTGWPSFWEPVHPENLIYCEDATSGLSVRIEVLCARCESHLGHVFDDGPQPTGKRYCINSLALKFVQKK